MLDEIQNLGYRAVVVGLEGEAEESLANKADEFKWIEVGNILDLVSFLKKRGIQKAIFVGKVDPRVIYNSEKFDKMSQLLLSRIKEKSPKAVIEGVIDFMAEQGVQVMDPTPFLTASFCQEGILTQTRPSPRIEEDISFGWKIAKKMADLEVGQTVIVKDKTAVAIEGIEGTDRVIKRGFELAGEGTVVIKTGRSLQDARVDLPVVGLDTVKTLIEASCQALCLEAQKVPFFQKEEAISLADSNKISIVVKKM